MQNIKVKVSIVADLIECNNVFSSTGVKMTEENILDYFKPGKYTYEDIENANGDHFLYGFVETIAQSDKYAQFLYDNDSYILYFEVELI